MGLGLLMWELDAVFGPFLEIRSAFIEVALALLPPSVSQNGWNMRVSTRPRAVLMDIGGFKRALASAFSMARLLEKEKDWSLRCPPLTGFMKIRTI